MPRRNVRPTVHRARLRYAIRQEQNGGVTAGMVGYQHRHRYVARGDDGPPYRYYCRCGKKYDKSAAG